MPNVNDMTSSNYLKAADFTPQGKVLTIRTLQEETLGSGKDAQDKWVIYFVEEEKGLVLNKTNLTTIAELHGDETDEWEDKQITLYQTKTEYQGKRVPALRVADEVPTKKAKPAGKVAGKATPAKARGGKATTGRDEGSEDEDADDNGVPY